ncbi:MAG: response regulator [Bacteroidia bacterium]|nr:response regulator [Bacteroidia bacterium]
MQRPQILILEDDMIIASDISLNLSKMGYEVVDIVPSGEEAIEQVQDHNIDIMLVDINLKGELDGIQTVKEIQQREENIGIIFLTANSDRLTYDRAKTTRPHAFISKPFKRLDLERAIELAILRMSNQEEQIPEKTEVSFSDADDSYLLEDRIFVRQKDQMIRIFIKDILYAEADRSYCKVFTQENEYLMSFPLKTFESKLNSKDFIRTHRSFIINITEIDGLHEDIVTVGSHKIPVGPSYKKDLLKRLKLI